MGILYDTLQKLKNKKLQNQNIGVNYFGREMIYSSSIIIHQHEDEIHIGKNRRNGVSGFVKLHEALDLIITEYMRSDLTNELTPFACWNVSIKQEIEDSIRQILIKNGILKRHIDR